MKLFGRLFMGLALATCIGFAGCGGADDAKKPDATTPSTGDKKEGASTTPPATGEEMVLVSLQLPNMT